MNFEWEITQKYQHNIMYTQFINTLKAENIRFGLTVEWFAKSNQLTNLWNFFGS